jgi:hypothetical protein
MVSVCSGCGFDFDNDGITGGGITAYPFENFAFFVAGGGHGFDGGTNLHFVPNKPNPGISPFF